MSLGDKGSPLDRPLAASDDTAHPMLSIQTAAPQSETEVIERVRGTYRAAVHARKRSGYLSSGTVVPRHRGRTTGAQPLVMTLFRRR